MGLGLPKSVEHRFQNTGNLHLVPRGIVEVHDPAGRVIERGSIDEDSSPILPESFRRYATKLMPMATGWLPGRYKVLTQYRYDGIDTTTDYTTYFWYMGQALTWLLGSVLAILMAGIIYWIIRRKRHPRKRSAKA